MPAVNNHGRYGRWAFIEISDRWDAANTIRGSLGMIETSEVFKTSEVWLK